MSNKDNKPKNTKFNAYWIYGIAIVLFLVFNVFSGGLGNSTGVSTTPSQFFKFLRNGDVKKVEIANH
jgi:cell division protease FtsH